MADVGDKAKNKKKIRRVLQKPDREFESFLPDNMRAPVIQVLGKPPHDYKGGSSNYSQYDHPHPHNWEKRGGVRYHDDWEKRGGYSGSGSTGGVLRLSEGTRNAIFSGDAGRPPGRTVDGDGVDGENSQNTGVGTTTPVILSRARSNSEQRSTSPNPTIITARKDSVPTVNSGANSSSQPYQIASKPLMMEASLTPERIMKGPARLLDESLSLCDDLSPYLLDQSNFLVVAMMGMQGVGKSALASLFVDPSVDVHKIRSVKNLGVIMSEDLTLKDHSNVSTAPARKMIGWIMRTFKTRDAKPMMILFKLLVLSRMEYCCTLTAPFKAGKIVDLESVQ